MTLGAAAMKALRESAGFAGPSTSMSTSAVHGITLTRLVEAGLIEVSEDGSRCWPTPAGVERLAAMHPEPFDRRD